jgi:hypothetical protein
MRTKGLLALALVATLASPALAFVTELEIEDDDGEVFTFDIDGDPQWELVTSFGTYRGEYVESARIAGTCGLSFSDDTEITLDDDPIEARLKGKIDENLDSGRITLKDLTNGRTITLDLGPSSVSCIAL